MRSLKDTLFFDPADYELVELVNRSIDAESKPHRLDPLFDPYLHPRGIKVLAAPIHKRIAHAVVQLLATLEAGQAEERIAALRSLRDEVFMGCDSTLRHNTARVLLTIMKALIRERGDEAKQLRLAHDFFAALSGRPALIRRELRRHHLLEMPEDWSQVAFDHHVHDANSKGRKSPSLLITDAWLKGIRELTVVYYGFIEPAAAAELAQAAEIMDVKLRIGIELPARFRGRMTQFIWAPRGFDGREDFLEFIQSDEVQRFFDLGRELAEYRKKQTLETLDAFNRCQLSAMNQRFGVEFSPLRADRFLAFVGVGQPSMTHLAEFLHSELLPLLAKKAQETEVAAAAAETPEEKARLLERLKELDALSPGQLAAEYLKPEKPLLTPVPEGTEGVPVLLSQTPQELVRRLQGLRTGYRLTLNPTGLTDADVLELLYDLEGSVTHVEIYNLKDRLHGNIAFGPRLMTLRRALCGDGPAPLKQAVGDILASCGLESMDEERRCHLKSILDDIPRFLGFYRSAPLKARIGSDSIGRAGSFFGMGLAVRSTLPNSVVRQLERDPSLATILPVRIDAWPVTRWTPRTSLSPTLDAFYAFCRHRKIRSIGYRKSETFETQEGETRNDEKNGNVITLGGFAPEHSNGFTKGAEKPERLSWHFLNSNWKNVLKILMGFVPACLTFALTQDWWLLTWFGALIWFAITGVRNVAQSVVSTSGLYLRSPFIRWRDTVNWGRVSDSLLYTGISVPLLDWLVKLVVLQQGFGVTTQTAPLLLYTVISLVNSVYIAAHNTFRGLPRAAVIGNVFRSVLAIPLAVAINAVAFRVLLANGMEADAAYAMLQLWAAIITKVSSDMVAAVIEGAADRSKWLSVRRVDYRSKLAQLFQVTGRLEVKFPEGDVIQMIQDRAPELESDDPEVKNLTRRLILSSLDLLYFWMYQPRARLALRQLLFGYTKDERRIIAGTQRILERDKEISRMFLDQLVGKNFSPPLSCYLEKWRPYVAELEAMVAQVDGAGVDRHSSPPQAAA